MQEEHDDQRPAWIIAAGYCGLQRASLGKAHRGGARVRVTNNQEIIRGCEFHGNVIGTGFWGPDEAIAIMQNKTAELGGNVVFVTFQGTGKNQTARGEAYRCDGVPQAHP